MGCPSGSKMGNVCAFRSAQEVDCGQVMFMLLFIAHLAKTNQNVPCLSWRDAPQNPIKLSHPVMRYAMPAACQKLLHAILLRRVHDVQEFLGVFAL